MEVYKKVEKILIKYPETKNSDKKLIWRFIAEDNSYITRERFMSMPSLETITRCRRKLQKRYPSLQAVKKIKEAREAKQQRFPAWVYGK